MTILGEQPVRKAQRVEGGWAEVENTALGVWVASWIEDVGTGPAGGPTAVPDDVARVGGDAALKWAVNEWNEKRLGREAPRTRRRRTAIRWRRAER